MRECECMCLGTCLRHCAHACASWRAAYMPVRPLCSQRLPSPQSPHPQTPTTLYLCSSASNSSSQASSCRASSSSLMPPMMAPRLAATTWRDGRGRCGRKPCGLGTANVQASILGLQEPKRCFQAVPFADETWHKWQEGDLQTSSCRNIPGPHCKYTIIRALLSTRTAAPETAFTPVPPQGTPPRHPPGPTHLDF